MDLIVVYMTAGSEEEARRIGRVLVEERLAACVNLLGPMRSVYRWKGEVEEAPEVAFIAKTRTDRFDALAARVAELHAYEVPCIVALPIRDGHAAYLDWLRAETA